MYTCVCIWTDTHAVPTRARSSLHRWPNINCAYELSCMCVIMTDQVGNNIRCSCNAAAGGVYATICCSCSAMCVSTNAKQTHTLNIYHAMRHVCVCRKWKVKRWTCLRRMRRMRGGHWAWIRARYYLYMHADREWSGGIWSKFANLLRNTQNTYIYIYVSITPVTRLECLNLKTESHSARSHPSAQSHVGRDCFDRACTNKADTHTKLFVVVKWGKYFHKSCLHVYIIVSTMP